MEKLIIKKGSHTPLGAFSDQKGVNFSLFSEHALEVTLLLFENAKSPLPYQEIVLDAKRHRTYNYWHCYVENLRGGVEGAIYYAYKVKGPSEANYGHRYNSKKVVIDPYARGISASLYKPETAVGEEENLSTSLRSICIDTSNYDWQGDRPLNRPWDEIVIYEMHVRGFTKDESAGVKSPGTYAGVIEKIPYLQSLGITPVELLPVFEFNRRDPLRVSDQGEPLCNYWGYDPIGFFIPESSYCQSPELGSNVKEFRDMVKAFHKAGIEVYLDVVFNHTAEGNHLGPTIHFKGIDNSVYYHLQEENRFYYKDFTGCGNTLNAGHPIVQKYIFDVLRFWVEEMHVDGFRFDLASVLTRGIHGEPIEYPPILWLLELSETFMHTKLIAEAWDAVGLYQIGHFSGKRWSEWNGQYRDGLRRFVSGEKGVLGALASRLAGSSDLYGNSKKTPHSSINFITCHDGFTLYDLVSYNYKHNEANGESNRDGTNDNMSWNCGVEGETHNSEIRRLRLKQCKNFMVLLFLSKGIPMILGGDEILRTQQGNNNAYCQDNEISWMQWEKDQEKEEFFKFVQQLIQLRFQLKTVTNGEFYNGIEINEEGLKDAQWYTPTLQEVNWSDPDASSLMVCLGGIKDNAPDILLLIHMGEAPCEFTLPPLKGRSWELVIDTAKESGKDFIMSPTPHTKEKKEVSARSIQLLLAKR